MQIIFGLETEIGITRRSMGELDVVTESIALVRSACEPGVWMRWDYRFEDPHLDARGFRVKQLRQDTDEANYFARDQARSLSWTEIKSDLVLRNGARFYNDHAHPEYCTPECSTLLELLQQDHTGDELLMACAAAASSRTDNPVVLYKNNTDFSGHSYGCHENYLIPRALPWEALAAGVEAFLVTRQIYCGAGKFGWESEDRFVGPGFQISQRSDFFSELQSVDTMQCRPIINTRDEPHADPSRWRRFHVILGDANMSPYATWLKIGTTALVLHALNVAQGRVPLPRLVDPLGALHAISRDATWRWECALVDGSRTTAVEIQRRYLEFVRAQVQPLEGEWALLAAGWQEVLDDLAREPLSTADRLDWSAKYRLVESFRAAEKLAPDDPWLRSLDLAYHELDRSAGLYFGLRDQGALRLPYPAKEISANGIRPPATTRAAVRGKCIERFGGSVQAANWDALVLRDSHGDFELDLRGLIEPAAAARASEFVAAAPRIEELRKLPFAKAR